MKNIMCYAAVTSWDGDAIYMRKKKENKMFMATTLVGFLCLLLM
jgi:hypothetical protein